VRRLRWLNAAVILVAACAAGCYQGTQRTVSLRDVAKDPGWTVVHDVPVIRQQAEHDCGPAALASILARWGIPDALAQIHREVASDPRGAAAGDLRDFAKKKGLDAFLIVGEEADLAREIASGRPVLVGLLQRYSNGQVLSHYEVVVGLNEARHRILLLDPGNGPREDSLEAFTREWQGSKRLTLIVAQT
jgi:ABC-type bacteriocin/lantibiotic exporter with double-glycine peptidase domain